MVKVHVHQRPKQQELIPVSLVQSVSRSIATPTLDGMLASPLLGYPPAVCQCYASNIPG